MSIVENNWEQVVAALRLTIDLISSWGFNWQNLPSSLAVIPLAYHLYNLGSPSNFITSSSYQDSRRKMHNWLRIALLKRPFSGSSDSILRNVRKAMKENSYDGSFSVIISFELKYVFLAGKIIRTARYVVMKLPAKYPFRDVYDKCMA